MYKNGIREIVYVDNFLPTKDDGESLAYSSANGKEMWVAIIEKAWAKMHGSYERIESGDTQPTVRDLTGAPGETLELDGEEGMSPENIYQRLKKADRLDHIICCSIEDKPKEEAARYHSLGLIVMHSYTLIAVEEPAPGLRLCLLRNPWGNFEWNGDWGD